MPPAVEALDTILATARQDHPEAREVTVMLVVRTSREVAAQELLQEQVHRAIQAVREGPERQRRPELRAMAQPAEDHRQALQETDIAVQEITGELVQGERRQASRGQVQTVAVVAKARFPALAGLADNRERVVAELVVQGTQLALVVLAQLS